ncbi:MAG: helix-turn-helix domain-containing protein [Oscillatoriaceae bacterium SKW80]|nr:helix-turn-helix domain-containing protein [Oscillatoriaceae bacterium SKYG93]MCX8121696.1 helix-turn-helix domain-containing protein [Oscillatoriaceae bacterium SKW80]MDW8454005.1 helix-turn-helix transcriptional regulator [Oscillatoriaceae cyanobacterium SKYGB_i_bin93]HIK28751.1 helix-turn-helix domain-containing protein [Oscillatoriaceae cyanobacterium M7585_C2015_266]
MSGVNPAFSFESASPSDAQGVENQVALEASEKSAIVSESEYLANGDWNKRLRELGEQIAQVRQAQKISLEQLHFLTKVPLYHLKALEMGRVELLPEPIYVRGFIRRIGSALGLDGECLAASLPITALNKSVLPSYKPSKPRLELFFSPVYFYFTYIAIVIAALAALSWLSHQCKPICNYPQFTNNTVELND